MVQRKWRAPCSKIPQICESNQQIRICYEKWLIYFLILKRKKKQTTKQNQNSTSSDSSMQYCVTFHSVWSKLLHYMEMGNSVILNPDIVLNGRHCKNSNSEYNSMDYIELAYRTGSE